MTYGTIYLLEERDTKDPEWSPEEDCEVYVTPGGAAIGRERLIALNAELIDTEGREYDGHLNGYEVRVIEYRRVAP